MKLGHSCDTAWRRTISFVCAQFILALSGSVDAVAGCLSTTPAWEQMEYRQIVAIDEEGGRRGILVKLADEAQEWSAGFQHVCPEVIAKAPMLFVFKRLYDGAFHMSNVHAPLDIGFFDEEGVLIELHHMQPYVLGSTQVGQIYRAHRPYIFALEARSGFFAENQFVEGQTRLILSD